MKMKRLSIQPLLGVTLMVAALALGACHRKNDEPETQAAAGGGVSSQSTLTFKGAGR